MLKSDREDKKKDNKIENKKEKEKENIYIYICMLLANIHKHSSDMIFIFIFWLHFCSQDVGFFVHFWRVVICILHFKPFKMAL